MRRHLPGVPDNTADVQTSDLRLVRAAILRAAADGTMAAISGPVGTGKTFAALSTFERLVADGSRAFWITMPDRPTKRMVLARLFDEVLGGDPKGLSEYDLTSQLVEHLSDLTRDGGCVVFIDEAHRLRASGLQTVRHLHQRLRMERDAQLTVVCIGSDLDTVLRDAPELLDRIEECHTLSPIPRAQVVATVSRLHPILEHTRPAVLLRLDDDYAHGRMRPWAKLLRGALRVGAKHNRGYLLDDDVPLVAAASSVSRTGRSQA